MISPYRISMILFFSVNFISCSAFVEEGSNTSTANSLNKRNPNLKEAIRSAKYDVDNINIYTTPNEYIGKIISTRGIFLEQKFFKDKEKKIIVSGSNNGHPADYLVYLDHPLLKQTKIGENIQVISTASGIRVFGRLKGLEDYMTEAGVKKQLPVLDAIAIYNIDDRELQNPVWVNLLYK